VAERTAMTDVEAESARTSLLEVTDLHASYGGVRALRGVSLAVREGEIVAVLGNNGAGKSTLMRAISGTLALHGGTVAGGTMRLRDRNLAGLDPAVVVRAGVVQVPESAARASPRRANACSSCSRGWPSVAVSARRCYPAASSRCWRSAGR
jgi:ABC-type dipeptide/oligopeptide/nickel transport system ATPase component